MLDFDLQIYINMCRAVNCESCGKKTWRGCGAHIPQALAPYSLEQRCAGWESGTCVSSNEKVSSEIATKLETGSCSDIEKKIRGHFKSLHFLEVKDLSDGCGSKFKVVIVSDDFEGISLVNRHRMVNGQDGALVGVMDNIHAIEMKTWTLAQYQKKMATQR